MELPEGWLPAIVAAVGIVAMALIGGKMTDLGPWYANLRFPRWKPPNWAFGPIWSVILLSAGTGIAIGWLAMPDGTSKAILAALLLLNGVLNVLWNYLFFKLRRPDFALAEVIALWQSILAIILFMAPHSAKAAVFFAPYLIWVGIAAALNRSIVQLNRPF